jgi:hypothetical protein
VELNRAIAVAEVERAEAGLALIERLELDGDQYFHSTRANLLRRLDRAEEARAEYERALELALHRAGARLPAAPRRKGRRLAVTAFRRRVLSPADLLVRGQGEVMGMTLMHPDIHREIARQRHEELLEKAERHRIANASRRLRRRRSDPTAERGISPRPAVDGAWEVQGSANRG